MEPAVKRFKEATESVTYKTPDFELIFNDTKYLREKGIDNVAGYLALQLVNGVNWTGCVKRLIKDGVNNYLQVGPKPVFSNLIKNAYGDNVHIIEINEQEE